VGTWTGATPLWYGFAPATIANATRFGEYVSSITLSNGGSWKRNDTLDITYSQSTNQPALGVGLRMCAHRDAASGDTIIFIGYSGATCNFTPATAATAQTQFGYTVQTAGTTGAFATDKTAPMSATWLSATQLQLKVTGNPSGGSITETATSWDYHVSATAPAGATQVKSSGSASLVAENASCPVATSALGW
jgi:hemolysin activation/secretion protein